MGQRKWTTVLKGLVLLGVLPAVAVAQLPQPGQFLPNVNLGFTSFLDGGPPAGPGVYFQEYVQYISADNFIGGNGRNLPLIKDLDVLVSLNQFIYQSGQAILPGGGRWGLDVIIPLIAMDVDPDIHFPDGSPVATDNNEGLGDIVIGPVIQWDPIMGKNGPIFMHRIELQNIVPSGKYDEDRVLNPGSNFYSFNPYWAATFFATPKCTLSWRLHYLWNAENQKPNKKLYPADPSLPRAGDTQAGEAIHVNFATEYAVLPDQLRVGLNGYYLEQIGDSEIDGKDVENWRAKVLGLGPGAVYHFSPNDHIFFNAYFEMEAEAQPEGTRFNLRWTHHF